MSAEDTEEPEDTEIRTMDALEWLLMNEGTLSAAAANYGIKADMHDEDLEGIAWMGVRCAYDEGFDVDEDSLLAALKLARKAIAAS